MTPDSSRRAAEPTPAAGGEHKPYIVGTEAAARAIAPEAFEGPVTNRKAKKRERARHLAREALAAAAPAIQARALHAAADGMSSLTERDAWRLRDRAQRIERGELP